MSYINPSMYRFLPLIILLLGAQEVFGQFEDKDQEFEHWQGLKAKYEHNKWLDIGFSLQTRWATDPGEINNAFLEIEPEVQAFKNLVFKGGYRYSTDFDERRNRLFIGAEPEVDLTKDLKIDIRIRFDHNWRGDDVEQKMRWRVRPEYDFGKMEVFVFSELFLDDAQVRSKWRYAVGSQYKFNKKDMIDLRAMVDAEIDKNVWILSLVYRRDF